MGGGFRKTNRTRGQPQKRLIVTWRNLKTRKTRKKTDCMPPCYVGHTIKNKNKKQNGGILISEQRVCDQGHLCRRSCLTGRWYSDFNFQWGIYSDINFVIIGNIIYKFLYI